MRLVTQTWNHTEPVDQDLDQDLQLLTICGISVLGRWQGALGEHYVGWCKTHYQTLPPLPPYNHTKPQERMYTQ